MASTHVLCELGASVTVLRECGDSLLVGCSDRCVSLDLGTRKSTEVRTNAAVRDCALWQGDTALLLESDELVLGSSVLQLPVPAARVLSSAHGLVVVCQDATVLGLHARNVAALPDKPSVASEDSLDLLGCCLDSQFLSLIARNRSGACVLVRHDVQQIRSNDWLRADDATVHALAVDCEQDSVVCATCATDPDCAVFLLLASLSVSARLVKVSGQGRTLFERGVAGTPISIAMTPSGLLVLTASELLLFDPRYGAQTALCAVDAAQTPLCSLGTATADSDAYARVLLARQRPPAAHCALLKTMAQLPGRKRTGLLGALGTLAPPPPARAASTSSSVLAAMPGPLKRKLLQAQSSLYEFINAECRSPEDREGGDGAAPRLLAFNRVPRFYIDLPHGAAATFVSALVSADASAVLPSDWSVLKVLVRSLTLKVADYPDIIARAIQADRVDVLSYILQYAPDLTEKQAVIILCYSSRLSEAALACLVHSGGEVHWRRDESQGKKRRKSKGHSEPADADADAVKDVPWTPCSGLLDVVRALCEAVLRRTSGFSKALVADAVSEVSTACASILLRVFSHLLRGLTTPCFADESCLHLGPFSDALVNRAIDWAEAIIDAHFSSISLNLISRSDSATWAAVSSAVRAVAGISEATDALEEVLGLWSHATRINGSGLELTADAFEVYQVEKLVF